MHVISITFVFFFYVYYYYRSAYFCLQIGSNISVLLGGSQIWGPGVFPQPLATDQYNNSEVYVLNMNPGQNQTTWKRILVEGPAPDRLDGASLAYDSVGGVVYLFGGRLVDR